MYLPGIQVMSPVFVSTFVASLQIAVRRVAAARVGPCIGCNPC